MSDPPKPRRGRPRTLDADKVLDAAVDAYRRSDPADVSVNAVCALAGVSKPALYREFVSEDGLMRAALDRYAEQVLSDIFRILDESAPLAPTLEALVRFASEDPRMETGCLFYKMRAGKHRLGPRTLEAVEAVDAGAVEAFAAYLDARRAAGDRGGGLSSRQAARYLVEQIGLALTQRAAGEPTAQVRDTLRLALSVFSRP
ncbi:MAG: TetR/AcrR family transcriptional regulator [Pseudomonadota bacterium]